MRIKTVFKLLIFKIISANKVAEKSGVKFGKNCKFLTKKFGSEPQLISIGDNFYTSSNVQFMTHDGSVNVIRNMYQEYKNIDVFSPIIIGNNVFIGYGAMILPGTTIGDNVIIGAGSVVKGNLSSGSIYAGIPAKFICSIDDYILKNKERFIYTKHLSKDEKKKIINAIIAEKHKEFSHLNL